MRVNDLVAYVQATVNRKYEMRLPTATVLAVVAETLAELDRLQYLTVKDED